MRAPSEWSCSLASWLNSNTDALDTARTATSAAVPARLRSSRAGYVLQRQVAFARHRPRTFEACPAGANRSVRELLNRPEGGKQVRGYLGHVVVGHLQDPEAATPGHERVANCPVLALGDQRRRVDRLTCGELEQITALAADARSLVHLRSVSIVLSGEATDAASRDAT